ncbi:MAG: hypothetical protein VYD19_01340 [Myxococcota bacterium]|nr:hypothetical protein [Myxococcota bacterium]
MKSRARPKQQHHIGDRMKLHLRLRQVAGETLRLISPRPDLKVKLSVNRFHGTWHLLGDGRSATLLAHLIWGLSYQRHPGTLILIQAPQLQPNPFDASPSPPILLQPAQLTHLPRDRIAALHQLLPKLGPSDQTTRWQTHGLSGHQLSAFASEPEERVQRIGGFLVYRAPPRVMRNTAMIFSRLPKYIGALPLEGWMRDQTHESIYGRGEQGAEGELQIFGRYQEMLSTARTARRELIEAGVDVHREPEQVWRRQHQLMKQRADALRKSRR